MKKKVYKIITKSINSSNESGLFCFELAIILFKNEEDVESIIRQEFQSEYENYLGEKIRWVLHSFKEVEEQTFLDDISIKAKDKNAIVLLSQFFETMEEHYNFFEKPFED